MNIMEISPKVLLLMLDEVAQLYAKHRQRQTPTLHLAKKDHKMC